MYKAITKCRICGQENLKTVMDLGMQKLTGVFPAPETDIEEGPLELVKCRNHDCGLVQLRHSFESEKMYGENYGYRSGLNSSMVEHLKSITAEIQKRISLNPGDIVLDIGSNDGTLLSTYQIAGLDRIGMDPTGKKFAGYYPEGVELVTDFFSAENVERVRPDKKLKVVTSIAMFYDLESPIGFARDIAKVLSDDGIWIMEQSYLPSMIRTMSYDTICHEHLEFYGMKQIMYIAECSGFKVIDAALNPVNGGSFQVVLARMESAFAVSSRVKQLLEEEEQDGFNGFAIFEKFIEDMEEHKKRLLSFIEGEKQKDKKIYGYGASTKGNVLLQYCGLTAQDILGIAEVNEDKFGKLTPGTQIPILSEKDAKAMNPDYFIVLPWHFRDNILRKEMEYMKNSGCAFVFPLPEFEIVRY